MILGPFLAHSPLTFPLTLLELLALFTIWRHIFTFRTPLAFILTQFLPFSLNILMGEEEENGTILGVISHSSGLPKDTPDFPSSSWLGFYVSDSSPDSQMSHLSLCISALSSPLRYSPRNPEHSK